MLQKLFARNDTPQLPQELYGRVVAQARLPVFFEQYGFSDTPMGRFDVLTIHVFLICHRLAVEKNQIASAISQQLFDEFLQNLEEALRELGIGDTSVPKRKKKLARSFYGLAEDIGDALIKDDRQTVMKKLMNRFYDNDCAADADRLAQYILAANDHLVSLSSEVIRGGELDWPDPADIQT